MSTQHTPGPWKVANIHANGFYGNSGEAMVTAEDRRICAVDCATNFKRGHGYTHVCAERDANTRLIAAAPDMLAALTYVLPWLEAHIGQGLSAHELDNIRATIAKATGEETNA